MIDSSLNVYLYSSLHNCLAYHNLSKAEQSYCQLYGTTSLYGSFILLDSTPLLLSHPEACRMIEQVSQIV
jgi:hypothetical protein